MSEIILPSTYNEPTVMWRMQRANGSSAHALIDTVEGTARVVWFVNGRPVGARYFDDSTGAIQWSERLRAQYWTVGWRLLSDDFTECFRARRES
jgi:hypothetical protein